MDYDKHFSAALQAEQLRQGFIRWLRGDADRLISAAQHSGGDFWGNQAAEVVDAIAFGAEPEELAAELTDLQRLLTFERAEGTDCVRMGHFLVLHPDDPLATDLQLCAEALERGLTAMRVYAETAIKGGV
ncbi:hypothetical protein O4G76_18700 [Limimaricola sp. G21655-S1]|uniref:hypothetical protein n=1 Tax=Limimaricola sp. G21655-S1 TaxID=3014768 RepID=UPI0022AFD67C|nr:hypothetical protein [Limimaricola sp. G21655-S1]MCZ4262870.1 hypothetical protein [Limimaricola sp. G21655-S1]